MNPKVWLITGCSTGFGRELSIYAAAQGDRVAGTVRKIDHLNEFNGIDPEKVHGILMDVTNSSQVKEGVEETVAKFGRIDVLVNNAGYGSLGAVEDVPPDEVSRQFDVNVFGALNLIRSVLPVMRKQRSGHIINVTSIAGLKGFPGVGIYNSSKFALEGLGEGLALDVKHLGIRVTNVEPGPFRTDWAGRSATFTPATSEDYAPSVGKNLDDIHRASGHQIGDPALGAKAMFDLTHLDDPPLHLPLGAIAYDSARKKYEQLLQEFDRFEYLGKPTDYPAEE